MTVWIFVYYLAIGSGEPLQVTGYSNLAFANKELCEWSIQDSKKLKCIELRVFGELK